MEDLPKIVAAHVKRLRKEQKLSQEALADLAGIDRSYLGALERAEYKLTVVTLGKLAQGLRVLPSVLVALPSDHPLHAEIASPPDQVVTRRAGSARSPTRATGRRSARS